MTDAPIRRLTLLVVDDHEVVRQGLVAMLDRRPNFQVVAEAGTVHYLTLQQIRDSISELGFTPRQRNVRYDFVSLDQERFAIEANSKPRPAELVQLASQPL